MIRTLRRTDGFVKLQFLVIPKTSHGRVETTQRIDFKGLRSFWILARDVQSPVKRGFETPKTTKRKLS
jgi:hypothetical protein